MSVIARRSRLVRFVCVGWLFVGGCVATLPAWAQETAAPLSRPVSAPASAPQPSLGDYARNLREKQRVKVKITPAEAQQIFKAVDDITVFASKDSGLAQTTPVKRQLVGQDEVEKMAREQHESEEEKQERQRGMLAMKKFGLLPRDFDVEGFAGALLGESVAGFYDAKTKMITLLNWVPLDEQKTVLAHELTHALQDQNFDLLKWRKQRKPKPAAGDKSVVNSDTDEGESSVAARSVTEGQAMVVMYDFLLAAYNVDLEHSPGLYEPLQEHMSYGSEGPVLHRAPLAIREGMMFPYREGLMFEIALLEKGSKPLAFSATLKNPPRLTHEILQPRVYIAHEKIAPVRIPDLRSVLGEGVRVQDTGVIGELDTRVFIRQYESNWLAKELAKSWRGGSYVTVARSPQGQPATTNDVALLYVSRWQSPEAAERFAKFYAAAVSKRYRNATLTSDWQQGGKAGQALASTEIATEEGPVVVEQWPDNIVFVSESFEAATSAQLREVVMAAAPKTNTAERFGDERYAIKDSDLTLRLAAWPELAPLRDAVHVEAVGAVIEAVQDITHRSGNIPQQ